MTENISPVHEKATYTLDEMIDEFIRTPKDIQTFTRVGWINQIMRQLVRARVEAGLTQADLAEHMGKQQSAIARLERNNDIKLSTLFDYLAALELTPEGEIPVKPYAEAIERFAGKESRPAKSSSSLDTKAPAELAAD